MVRDASKVKYLKIKLDANEAKKFFVQSWTYVGALTTFGWSVFHFLIISFIMVSFNKECSTGAQFGVYVNSYF